MLGGARSAVGLALMRALRDGHRGIRGLHLTDLLLARGEVFGLVLDQGAVEKPESCWLDPRPLASTWWRETCWMPHV